MIVFLDYDGVLHPDPCPSSGQLFQHAPRLSRVLEEFPEVGVVLSTSWRNQRTVVDLLEPLPERLRRRVIGVTPRFGDLAVQPQLVPYRRHAECVAWLQMNQLDDAEWIALDDRPAWFLPYCENLITCNPARGFDEAGSLHLASKLRIARERMKEAIDVLLM